MDKRRIDIRDRARFARDNGAVFTLSSISLFELWYGVAKSERIEQNTERLADFLIPTQVLQFDEQDAHCAGQIRATLERRGRPIGSYDYLIAGQAMQRDLLLVTNNIGEFSRIDGLRWEDWSGTR